MSSKFHVSFWSIFKDTHVSFLFHVSFGTFVRPPHRFFFLHLVRFCCICMWEHSSLFHFMINSFRNICQKTLSFSTSCPTVSVIFVGKHCLFSISCLSVSVIFVGKHCLFFHFKLNSFCNICRKTLFLFHFMLNNFCNTVFVGIHCVCFLPWATVP